MKRELKFRCWCRDGEWEEEGDKMKFTMIDADSLCFNLCIPLKDQLTDIEDEQYFMQYTGLKDKNGVEIYEGDIVNGCCFNSSYAFGVISQSKTGWCVLPIGKCIEGYDEIYTNGIEVIGNIYQNPDLLP